MLKFSIIAPGISLFLATLVVVPALAIDKETLKEQGFQERVTDGRTVWINDRTHQVVDLHIDGSYERTIHAFRLTLDDKGKPIDEKFVAYVIACDADDKVDHVTDEFGISYLGDHLVATEEGVSFIDQFDRKVTLRSNGSRLVANDQGKGASIETWETGLLRRRYNAEAVATHLYGYGMTVSPEQAAQEPGRATMRLTGFIGTNSRGEKEYWKLTNTDASTGRQTWMLQNGKDGQTVALKDVHRLYVERDGGIVIEHPVGGKDPRGGRLVKSSTRHNLDGARVEHRVTELSDGDVLEVRKVFGSGEAPAYAMETRYRGDGDPRQIVDGMLMAGQSRYTTKDGAFWVKDGSRDPTPNEQEAKPEYFRGEFQLLGDGSYVQRGFAVDADDKRIITNGEPSPWREFLIDTTGMSLELHGFTGPSDGKMVGRIYRDRRGDVLKLVDVLGRECSFVYSIDADDQGQRLIRGVNDYRGEFWVTEDGGKTWNRPLASVQRDSSDTMTMQVDRDNGNITWEGWNRVVTEKLDGTLEVNLVGSERRQVFDREGLIVLSINERGDQFEFEYDDKHIMTRCQTTHPALKSGAGYTDSNYHVDWNGKVSFERRYANDSRVERRVLLPDGTLQVSDEQDRLLQVSHPTGHESQYLYDDAGLLSMTRATRNGKQVIKRNAPGMATITFHDDTGEQSSSSEASLTMSAEGMITLDHGVLSDPRAAKLEVFLPDGSRRLIRQDLSGQRLDAFDRLRSRSTGAEWWVIGYEGDEDVPHAIADEQGIWEREEGSADAEAGEYVWTERYSGLTWSGVTDTLAGRFLFRGETSGMIDVFDDETVHILASGGRYRTNADDVVIEAATAHGLRWSYDYESNQVHRATSFKGEGENVEIQTMHTAGRECERITLNETTGLPDLHLQDGTRLLWHVSGATLKIDATGNGSSIVTHTGDSIMVEQAYEGEFVERIEYDAEHDEPRLTLRGGKTMVIDSSGNLITRFADGRLAWTARPVQDAPPYRIDYQYSSERSLIGVIQRQVPQWSDNSWTLKLEQTDDGPVWRMSGSGDDMPTAYEAIRVDAELGQFTLIRNHGRVIETRDALGDVTVYTLSDSGTMDAVQRDARGDFQDFQHLQGDRYALFRQAETSELILIDRNSTESLARKEKDSWESSSGDQVTGCRITADRRGVVSECEGVSALVRPNGHVEITCVDGSQTVRRFDDFVAQHYPAEGAVLQEVLVHANGSSEAVFVGGARHIQRANERLVRRVSATGKQLGAFHGAIAVSPYGTVTEVDFDHEFATVFPRDGGKAIFLSRKASSNGRRAEFFDGRRHVELSRIRARDPWSLSPPVGLGQSEEPSPLLTLLSQTQSRDAQSPKLSPPRKKSASPAATSDDEFKKLDRDSDGKLTMRELSGRQRIWMRGDKNRDRALTFEEWQAVAGGPAQNRAQDLKQRWIRGQLAAFDDDGDGKLTREEAPPKIKSLIDRFDANGDGLLDTPELERYQQAL